MKNLIPDGYPNRAKEQISVPQIFKKTIRMEMLDQNINQLICN